MVQRNSTITTSELDVLKVLWKRGPVTVRGLESHFKKRKGWAYTTIQTLLYRLEEKGFVTIDKSASPHVFEANVSRRELLSLRLRDLVDTLCDGTATPLLMTLVEDQELSPEALDELRGLLDRLESDAKKPNSRRNSR